MNKFVVDIINKFALHYTMIQYNDTIPYWNEDSVFQLKAKQAAGAIHDISKNIQDYSLQARETMRTLRESGAIPELALAIREGSFAVRDIVRDVNETTQELKQAGIIRDTASAVENTFRTAEESIQTVKDISSDASHASPKTSKAVKEGFETLRKETSHATEKVMIGIKNKVGA